MCVKYWHLYDLHYFNANVWTCKMQHATRITPYNRIMMHYYCENKSIKSYSNMTLYCVLKIKIWHKSIYRVPLYFRVRKTTFSNPLGTRGVATQSTKHKYSRTMHSLTLVSGKPNSLIRALSSAGRPTPNTSVRKTEKDTSSTPLITDRGAILTFWCLFSKEAVETSPPPRGHGYISTPTYKDV